MDTNRIFTNLFGGWLTAADKAAAATINYTSQPSCLAPAT